MQGTAKRATAVIVLAAAFALGAGATAAARIGSGSFWIGDDWGYLDGYVTFYAAGTNHGGMGISGNLRDLKPTDGRFVYADAKVHGYSYTRLWNNYEGGQNPVYGNRVVYDPATTRVSYGWAKVCANHPLTDPCVAERHDRS